MDKQNLSIIIIFVLSVLALIGVIVFLSIQNETTNTAIDLSNTNSLEEDVTSKNDVVIIKNGKIENELLIDEFTEKAIYSNIDKQELNIIQDGKQIKVTYTPGEIAKLFYWENTDGTQLENDGTSESMKKIYGYYTLIVNDEITGEYALKSHSIKRMVSNDTIILYFDSPLIDYVTIPEICRYSLASSKYIRQFEISYIQRKDLGVKTVFDAGEYLVKTFGGDVLIVIDGDMVYNLEDALNSKVITPNDIIEQAKIDMKFGVCEGRFYKDGGSIEYGYNGYTILKLNTGNGDKDLVIGMQGQIIDSYNKNK